MFKQHSQLLIFMSTLKFYTNDFPDSKVHGANMGPTWVLSAPAGPHVGPMNFAIRVAVFSFTHAITMLHQMYLSCYIGEDPGVTLATNKPFCCCHQVPNILMKQIG